MKMNINKKGAVQITLALILIIVIAIFITWFFTSGKSDKLMDKTSSPLALQPPTTQYVPPISANTETCGFAVPVSLATTNSFTGATVTSTKNIRINYGSFVTTTVPSTEAGGKHYDILYNATNYVAKIKSYDIKCDGLTDIVGLDAAQAPSFQFKNNDGLTSLTNTTSGGPYNATKIAAGGFADYEITLTEASQKTTGDMIVVVETASSANISKISLNGFNAVAVSAPSSYAQTLNSPKVVAFKVPAIVGSANKKGYLKIELLTGKPYTNSAVKTTWYGVQPFLDSDSSFNTAGVVEDQLGTAHNIYKTINSFFVGKV